jgi:hydrogenase maturation protease
MNSKAVLGIGNVLQGDDGVGVWAVQRLEALQRDRTLPDVELYDGGTAPFDMMRVFLEHDCVLVVDCVKGGHAPGTIYRLTAEDIAEIGDGVRFAHGLSVSDTLRVARELGSTARIVVFGVEPARVDWSFELSSAVEAAMPRLLEAVREELDRCPARAETERSGTAA